MKDHERSRRQMKRHHPWSSSFINSIKPILVQRGQQLVIYHVANGLYRQITPEGSNGVPYTQDPLFCELRGVNENEI